MGTTTRKSSRKKVYTQKAISSKGSTFRKKSSVLMPFLCIVVISVTLLYLVGPREKVITLTYDFTGIVLPETLPWEYREVTWGSGGPTAPAQPIPQTALEIPRCAHTTDSHEIHEYLGFSLCYREKYEQAEWVAYEINTAELIKQTRRTDSFRSDPNISTGSATPVDYKGSGYDRGHLAPAADLAFSKETMKESFYMSNISPQAGGFNRGVWKNLEEQVREWAAAFGSLYVISGPILEKDSYPTIGENQVAIPEYYYKVLFAPEGKDGKPQMIGFLMANQETKEDYLAFAVPVDEIESRTGLDFFHSMNNTTESTLESRVNIQAWQKE